MHKKAGKEGRRPAHLSKDLLVKLKHKTEIQRQWNQGQVSLKEYRDTTWVRGNEHRRAKAQLDLHMARDAKSNKK